jgi:hypothetical protein
MCTIIKKYDKLKIEGKAKIPLFTLNFSLIDVWTRIFVQSMWSLKKKLVMNKQNKIRVEVEQWSCLLNKSIVIVETKNHSKY